MLLKSDVGRYLLAVVSYTDAHRNVDDVGVFSEAARDRAGLKSRPIRWQRTQGTERRSSSDEDSDTPGTQNQTAMREVEENTKTNVGKPGHCRGPRPQRGPADLQR